MFQLPLHALCQRLVSWHGNLKAEATTFISYLETKHSHETGTSKACLRLESPHPNRNISTTSLHGLSQRSIPEASLSRRSKRDE